MLSIRRVVGEGVFVMRGDEVVGVVGLASARGEDAARLLIDLPADLRVGRLSVREMASYMKLGPEQRSGMVRGVAARVAAEKRQRDEAKLAARWGVAEGGSDA